jgi:hypothetical protein
LRSGMALMSSSVSSCSRQMNSAPLAALYTVLTVQVNYSTGVVSGKPILRRIS